MTTLEKLSELIDSLPSDSVTRANLLAVRGAMRASEAEEWLLHAALKEYCTEAIPRLRPSH